MTHRIAAVLVTEHTGAGAPPGVARETFLRAVAEDTYEMIAGLELVSPVILSAGVPGLDDLAWPGTPVLDIGSADKAFAVLTQSAARLVSRPGPGTTGDIEAVVVAADAPDLPPLLIGKLFRELGRAELAVCPAANGGAVAIAARLPIPDWATPDLDAPNPVALLRAQAPGPRRVATGPGWHRLRTPADLAYLDTGLEGWDFTRDLLSGH